MALAFTMPSTQASASETTGGEETAITAQAPAAETSDIAPEEMADAEETTEETSGDEPAGETNGDEPAEAVNEALDEAINEEEQE